MTPEQIEASLRRTPVADLLPRRSQARATGLDGDARLIDALDLGDGCLIALVDVAERQIVVPGRVRGDEFARDAGVAVRLHDGDVGSFRVSMREALTGPVRTIDVDQSNDSVVLADTVVKWQVDLAPSPAPQRLRALVDSRITAEPRAIVEWVAPDGQVCTVLTATDFKEQAQDGWTWAVNLVRAHAQGLDVDAITPFSSLGTLVGRMHLRFAEAELQAWGPSACAAELTGMRASLAEALRIVDGEEGRRLQGHAARLAQLIEVAADIQTTPVMPIHGDLHIGQVLRDDHGMVIIDFDGNPLLSPAQRCQPAPAARDIAGMLASLDHVARVVNHRTPGLDPGPAAAWIEHAQRAFLSTYREELKASGMSHLLDERWVGPMLVDQECREFRYAVRFLPHWRYVPDAAITRLTAEDP